MRRYPSSVFFLLGLGLLVSILTSAERSYSLQEALDAHQDDYRARGSSFGEALLKISADLGIPMGIEWVRTEKTIAPVDIQFTSTSSSEIIARLLETQPSYQMQIDNGVIQIHPQGADLNPSGFLNLRLEQFVAKGDIQSVANAKLHSLAKVLLHPSRATARSGGVARTLGVGLGGDRIVNLDLRDVAIRTALNRIVVSAGETSWIVTYPEQHTVNADGYQRSVFLFGDTNKLGSDDTQPIWMLFPWEAVTTLQ